MKNQILLSAAVASALLFAAVPAFSSDQAPSVPDNNSEQPVTDTWITTKVKAELATTDGVKSTDISVTTVDGGCRATPCVLRAIRPSSGATGG